MNKYTVSVRENAVHQYFSLTMAILWGIPSFDKNKDDHGAHDAIARLMGSSITESTWDRCGYEARPLWMVGDGLCMSIPAIHRNWERFVNGLATFYKTWLYDFL